MMIRLLLLTLLFSSCRTIRKSSSETESSTAKTEQNSSKYNREVITEYVVDTLWRTRLDTLYKTIAVPDYHVVEKPYIIRQTIREQGEQKSEKAEQTELSELVKEKEASVPVLLQWAAIMIAGALLLIGVAQVIKQFK